MLTQEEKTAKLTEDTNLYDTYGVPVLIDNNVRYFNAIYGPGEFEYNFDLSATDRIMLVTPIKENSYKLIPTYQQGRMCGVDLRFTKSGLKVNATRCSFYKGTKYGVPGSEITYPVYIVVLKAKAPEIIPYHRTK